MTLPRYPLTALAGVLLATLPSAAWPVGFTSGDLDVKLRARAQYDALLDSDAPKALQNDDDFRRVRVGISTRYGDDWRLGVSGDFVDKPQLRDLSLEYRGLPVRIEVGRFQEPFGLAEYGGSTDTLFMERPSPASFGPNYGLGGALNYRGRIWAISVGMFEASTDNQFGGDANEDAVTGRVTLTPLRGDTLIHFGAGYTDRKSRDTNGIRISGSAETSLVRGYTPRSPRDLGENHYSVAGAEFALRRGPVLFQSEYFDVNSDGTVGGNGWYTELGWALTGEKRDYSVRYGNFDGITPRRSVIDGGIGAVELGIRYSYTDLSDGGGDKGKVAGVALNWYPLEQLRLSVNAQRVKLNEVGSPQEETDVIHARVQVAF